MRLGEQIPIARKAARQCLEDLIGVGEFGKLSRKIQSNLVFQSCSRRGEERYDILSHAAFFIDEPIVVRDAAENAVEPHLILVGKRRVKFRRLVIVHRLYMQRQIDAPIKRILRKQQRFHRVDEGAA